MESFSVPAHVEILRLMLQAGLLLLAARILGELALRLGQPAVIGEILSGILLGPSLLASWSPLVHSLVMPQTAVQAHLIELLSLLGALFLMLMTGLEMDLALIRRHARTALGVSLCGLAVTFASGFYLGSRLPDEFLIDSERRTVFQLFLATAMSITAIPVLAKVLFELNFMRRDIGQKMIAAGMSDDTVGWILLSIATVMAALPAGQTTTPSDVFFIILRVLGFPVLALVIGRRVVNLLLRLSLDRLVSADRILTLVVVVVFLLGAAAVGLGLEAMLGAFVAGMIFSGAQRMPESVGRTLQGVSVGVFSPIFFALAGLKVDLRSLLDPALVAPAALVIGVACLAKLLGAYLGARLIGRQNHWEALSFGAGLNARGAMEILVATIGLKAGIINAPMFSVIILLAIITTLMAPPLLRAFLLRIEPGEEEKQRLMREELAAVGRLANIRRVLLPLRVRSEGGSANRIEAELLRRLARNNALRLTLMSVAPDSRQRNEAQQFLKRVAPIYAPAQVELALRESKEPADAIVGEAQKDYDLVLLGAPEERTRTDTMFAPLVDYVVRFSPAPTLVVRGPKELAADWRPRRILAPTNGNSASRRAVELAFLLAGEGDQVTILSVVETRLPFLQNVYPLNSARRREIAADICEELAEVGRKLGVDVATAVESGMSPEHQICDFAAHHDIDLVVIGTDVRPGASRLFLGPRVEHILSSAGRPVIVFNGR